MKTLLRCPITALLGFASCAATHSGDRCMPASTQEQSTGNVAEDGHHYPRWFSCGWLPPKVTVVGDVRLSETTFLDGSHVIREEKLHTWQFTEWAYDARGRLRGFRVRPTNSTRYEYQWDANGVLREAGSFVHPLGPVITGTLPPRFGEEPDLFGGSEGPTIVWDDGESEGSVENFDANGYYVSTTSCRSGHSVMTMWTRTAAGPERSLEIERD